MPDTILRAFDRTAPDLVINTAAYTAVDNAKSEPDLAHAINAAGAAQIARICERNDVPILHLSTDYVFDGAKPEPYTEDDITAPLGVYGRTKLAGEHLVAAACPRHLILRTSWIVSPYGHNFIRTMLRLAQSRHEIGVVDDQHGTPTFAPHLATCVLTIAESLIASGNAISWGVYHAAGTGQATWCQLAREVFLQSARLKGPIASVRAISTAEYPTTAARPANSRLDCTKLEQVFGIRLPDWRSWIAECVHSLVVDQSSRTQCARKGEL